MQYKTLDKLCNYLGITPEVFFEYAPFELNYGAPENDDKNSFAIEVNSQNIVRTYFFDTSIKTENLYAETRQRLREFDLYVSVGTEFDFYEEVYSYLTIGFKNLVNQKIVEYAYSVIENDIDFKDYNLENRE